MTHFTITHVDLTKHGSGGPPAAAHTGRHARSGHATHHAAGSLPAAHILLLALSAVAVVAAALLVAFA
ncbi:MAG: hypothetical protein HOY69_02785 [Streptomyces sp.]|nr:hypothetical protein [Streptomyces sp.]